MGLMTPVAVRLGAIPWMPKLLPQIVWVDTTLHKVTRGRYMLLDLAGLPGMSVPAGFGDQGMPVGLQLIGNYFQEGALLQAAHAFQQATDWHQRAPAEH